VELVMITDIPKDNLNSTKTFQNIEIENDENVKIFSHFLNKDISIRI